MTDSIFKLATGLLKNGLRFQYLKWSGKPGRPQAVSLEITHDCIEKCIMCNIWKIPREVPSLSMNDWIHLLSSDLFSDLRELDITGGEPFTKRDLPDLFTGICELKRINLKALRSIAITTNGLLAGRVLEYAREIVQKLKDEDMDLVLRYFELRLLDYVGYRPQLFQCVRCAQTLGTDAGLFSSAEGGVLCLSCGQGQRGCRDTSSRALATLRHLQTRDYDQCSRLKVDRRAHEELENLLRRYVTYLLERGLKSTDFMDALRNEEARFGAPTLGQG